ncbi:MAG: heme-binding protein [Betaproteobacteria bacterium]
MSAGRAWLGALLLTVAAALAGCGGGNGAGNGSLQVPSPNALTVADVQQVIAQAVGEAQARGAKATIAVVDRVGNVLAIFQMNGAATTFTITGGTAATGGLEKVSVLPSTYAVISKAITAAYFSSAGNAFTTRTAGQIIQQNFNPGVANAPNGPLFGVEFSQITCSDVSQQASAGSIGPKRAPIGFAADPGGLPLYKNGNVVGAIGVLSDATYTVDLDIQNFDTDADELIAVAGTSGFAAPTDIRADRITADGVTLRFTDSESILSNPANAPAFGTINGTVGALVSQPGYGGSTVVAGTAYGTAASGIRADASVAFAGTGAYILVDAANNNRYPPVAGSDGLMTAAEVTQILKSSLEVANKSRAQVRRPVGSTAQVSAVVVDTNGNILGYVRSPDALVDSVDVVVQKARTAGFFSNPNAAAELSALPPANYIGPPGPVSSPISAYVTATKTFFNDPTALANGIAFSTRSVGNIAAPYFPEGISGTANGPLAKPLASWSIFNNGLALDLVYNKLIASLVSPFDTTSNCTGNARIRSGITLFGGGFPIYRGSQLVGAIGVSGDGTDQSDLIAFLGVVNAGKALGTGIGHAPPAMRADTLVPQGTGTRLRYVNCPQSPFNGSTEQNVCAGL